MSGTDSISDSVPNLQHLTALYTFLHVAGGLVGLPIIIGTVLLSRHASRHPTMINLFISLFIYSLSYMLLRVAPFSIPISRSPLDRIFGRQQDEQFDPAGKPSALCQAQQALVHGAPTITDFPIDRASTAGLIVVIQVRRESSIHLHACSYLLLPSPTFLFRRCGILFGHLTHRLPSPIMPESCAPIRCICGIYGRLCCGGIARRKISGDRKRVEWVVLYDIEGSFAYSRHYAVPGYTAVALLFVIIFEGEEQNAWKPMPRMLTPFSPRRHQTVQILDVYLADVPDGKTADDHIHVHAGEVGEMLTYSLDVSEKRFQYAVVD
ncbi:uncharacterized protein SCHCODRAFT_0269918 [Schizophyllum commune H4-8]